MQVFGFLLFLSFQVVSAWNLFYISFHSFNAVTFFASIALFLGCNRVTVVRGMLWLTEAGRAEVRTSGFVTLQLRSARPQHPLGKIPRSGKAKLKKMAASWPFSLCVLKKNNICFYLWNWVKCSHIKPCMNVHSVLQRKLSKVKDQSWQLGFRNQRDRIIIQLFAYLRLSPLDTPVKAVWYESKRYKQIHGRRGRKKKGSLFLSSNQKRTR